MIALDIELTFLIQFDFVQFIEVVFLDIDHSVNLNSHLEGSHESLKESTHFVCRYVSAVDKVAVITH